VLSFKSSSFAEESFKSLKDISTLFGPDLSYYLGFSPCSLLSFKSANDDETSPFYPLTLSSEGFTDYPSV